MRYKIFLGSLFLVISAVFLIISFNPSITGNTIGTEHKISSFYFISLISFMLSLLIFMSRQRLDAIMIPTGTLEADKKRTDRAVESYLGGGGKILLISGRMDKPLKTSQVYAIYKRLRSYGVKPGQIRVEGSSANSLENILFSMEKLKKMGVRDMGIASYPTHLDRFEYIIKKAKKEGIIDRDFKIHRLATSETLGEHIYGVFSNWLYKYELRKGLRNAEKPWFHAPIKRILDYFVRHLK